MIDPTATQVSIDIETLGTRPGSVILSIGAVRFNADCIFGEGFYRTISIADSLRSGLTVDGDTLRWWLSQTAEQLHSETFSGTERPLTVLTALAKWLADAPFDGVWTNDPSFDAALLNEASVRSSPFTFSDPLPLWDHKKNRCYRTLRALGVIPDVTIDGLTIAGKPVPNVKHHALRDAVHQALGIAHFLAHQTPTTSP